MHCPLCGEKLIHREQNIKPPPEITYFETSEEIDKLHKLWEKYKDPNKKPENFDCKKCDIVWIHHNPYRGIESTPTDYWSLSYIK